MFEKARHYLSKLFNRDHVPAEHVRLTYNMLNSIASRAPVKGAPPEGGVPLQAGAYERWSAVATIIFDTPCDDADKNGRSDAFKLVQQIASQIKAAPGKDDMLLEKTLIEQLLNKRMFLKEMAKYHTEKGSNAALPYIIESAANINVRPIFANSSEQALRAVGRDNARTLLDFTQRLDNLAREIAPKSHQPEPQKTGYTYQRRWGR